MTAKVEDYFITPLEAHFESQPTEGQRATILEDMEPYSDTVLADAVEWLKRSRQSAKTFPSPKECNKAIAAVRAVAVVPESSVGQPSPSGTYSERIAAWVKSVKTCEVIEKGTVQWEEWEAYFNSIGATLQLGFMETREKWTVPTKVPQMFDPAAYR